MKKFLKFSFRTFLALLVLVLLTIAMAFYALQWSEVQTALTQKATKWLSEKLGTTVTVGQVKISWLDEITLEDVVIKDLENRDMIFMRELYINCKSNFDFDFSSKDFIKFDNNFDFVLLKEPDVKLIREQNGDLNMDRWIAKVVSLSSKKTKATKENNTPFTIDEAIIQNGTFTMSDPRKESFPKDQFDYYNFKIEKLSANLKEFFIQGDTIIFKGRDVKGVNKRSDLVIDHIHTDFFYSSKQMLLTKLDAKINNSYLSNFLGFYYNSPSDFSDFNNRVILKSNLRNTTLDAQDLGRFASNMYQYKEKYLISTDLNGTVKDLKLTNTILKFGTKSSIAGNMRFKGFPDLAKTNFDLELSKSIITTEDARQYAGEKYYQDYVKKFGTVNFEGIFQGTYNNFYTDAKVNSALIGNADGKLTFKIDPISKKPKYSGDLEISGLDIAELTDTENLLDKITFKGKMSGEGTNMADAQLKLDGIVREVYFNGYNFRNIDVKGDLLRSKFDGFIKVNDENLRTQILGKIDFNKAQNEFHIAGIVERANLKSFGLVKEDYILQTNFNLDFDGNDLDNWLGNAKFNNVFLRGKDKSLVIDNLKLTSQQDENNRVLGLQSDFLNAKITGSFVPSVLAKDLVVLAEEYQLFFNGNEDSRRKYYNNKKLTDSLRNYKADYQISFKNSSDLFEFINPEIYISEGSNLSGNFRLSRTSSFSSFGEFDTLRYASNTFINNEIDFYSSKNSFSPDVLTSIVALSDEQLFSNGANTEQFELNGSWGSAKEITFDSFLRQKGTKNTAQIFGKLDFLANGYDLKINPRNSKIHILESDWKFDKDNLISFNGKNVCFDQFEIINQNQSLAVNGDVSENENEELLVTVRDFDLKTLKSISDLDLKGVANGEAMIRNIYKNPVIVSNLFIDEMIYKDILVGTIASEVKWDEAIGKMTIQSNTNRINQEILRLNGTYDPNNPKNGLDLDAEFRRANLEILGTFVEDIFGGIKGYADGKLKITGDVFDPEIRGRLAFSRGEMKLLATGTQVYFDDEIVLNEEGFVASEKGFEVRDALVNGNTATLQGGVFNGGGGNFMLGLHAYFQGKNGFKLFELTENQSDVFYGTAYAAGDVHLTGSFNDILVTANLTSKPNTKITIPLDGATTVDVDEEAIAFKPRVDFTKENEKTENEVGGKPVEKINTNGLKMAFNLRLTPDAECEIIFDRQNNDKLNAFGNGRLSIEYDTRGGFTMSGPYIVTKGKYDFSFQNLASLRKFEILDGSRITWAGNPYNALLDVKAGYSTTYALREIPGINLTDASEGNNRYPLSVVINLKGQLETPEITYDLNIDKAQLPIKYQTDVLAFEQRLRNDEQLLSRNVSTILAFNQIFSENDLAAIGQQFLVDNISNILSNQIGNLANKLDPNLELGVLLGDFRQNLTNNLQFNVSYKFLNNRIKLSGNSSFSNTGNGLINDNSSAVNQGLLSVGGEVEWLLSPDGTWKLKGYSRSVPNVSYLSTSAVGNVVASGINVLFSRNFNTFFPKSGIVDKQKAPTKIPLGVGRKEDEQELSFKNK